MLTAEYREFEVMTKDMLKAIAFGWEAHEFLLNTFPIAVEATYCVSLDYGPTLIRIFINLPKDAPEEQTKRCVGWMLLQGMKTKREFRTDQGTFYWRGSTDMECRRTPEYEGQKYELLVLVENAHAQECRIEKRTVTKEEFYSVCPGDEEAKAQESR